MSFIHHASTKESVMETAVVIFRVDRIGVVFALFPELPADYQGLYCTCYQHVGQHCSAEYYGCIADSRPATPTEHADLFGELKWRGYNMRINQRASNAMHERRRTAAAYESERIIGDG
jgi:hypothetical protein